MYHQGQTNNSMIIVNKSERKISQLQAIADTPVNVIIHG